MPSEISQSVLQRVQTHAFESLSFAQRTTTNLHIDTHIYERGETIGPKFQKIAAPQLSILVFADHEPLYNFGHTCRYLLYEERTGKFLNELPARFPPLTDAKQRTTLKAFHEPVQFITNPNLFKPLKPVWRCPKFIAPEGTRYALLFSGMSNKRHLNDLEFLYRTLLDDYSFDPAHIYALNYDGTLNTQDGVQTIWPGDGTSYRIKVTGKGDQAGFEAAMNDLKGKLQSLDTLLIHCNNHGDSDTPDGGITWVPDTAYLCTYSNWSRYYHTDFCNKLAELPAFRQLIIMLEQCHSGGFNASILAKSPAGATSVASAATEFQNSCLTSDGNWDPFARDWIAAQAGHDPYGTALSYNPDSDGDGKIQAEEAYQYAYTVRDLRDTPNFSESSEAGGDIALGQEYRVWQWWCPILYEQLAKYHLKLPIPEYYERLHAIGPQLTKLTAELTKTSEGLRKEMQPRIEALVKEAFKSEGKAARA
jgi:hypothetical protein